MKCAHCQTGVMRLVRFEQRQEVFACNHCQHESLLLDCPLCERRLVRRLPDSAAGIERWACYRCQRDKFKCPRCHSGWVLSSPRQASGQQRYCCEHCDAAWPAAVEIR